jgi:ribonuclease HI
MIAERIGWKVRYPPTDWVKLNTDASFYANSGEAGAGIVVWNAAGEVELTSWRMLRCCRSPEEVEAEACLQGLKLGSATNLCGVGLFESHPWPQQGR